MWCSFSICFFFFFNDTATTEIYTLSLHDALPIYGHQRRRGSARLSHAPERRADLRDPGGRYGQPHGTLGRHACGGDRKSTRLNSSHGYISYAVFCLKQRTGRLTPDSAFAMAISFA